MHNSPLKVIPFASNFLFSEGSVDDTQLYEALSKIFKWPITKRLVIWNMSLMQGLINSRRYNVLIKLIRTSLSASKAVFVLIDVFLRISFLD